MDGWDKGELNVSRLNDFTGLGWTHRYHNSSCGGSTHHHKGRGFQGWIRHDGQAHLFGRFHWVYQVEAEPFEDWRGKQPVRYRDGDTMAVLKAAMRNALPSSTFGLPGSRKYPMPDPSHAANAKARATQQVAKGNLSPASAAKIRAKANKVLGK